MVQCAALSLNEKEVEEFITNHYTEKVGYEEAVDGFKADIGQGFTMMHTLWESRPFPIENVKGEWFYEDSATVEIFDIYINGGTP